MTKVRWELRDTPNYRKPWNHLGFMVKIHVGPATSTPLPVSPLFNTVGDPLLDYPGLISDDVETGMFYTYMFARVSVNAMFYIAAAATVTIADQLLALVPDEVY